MRERVSRKEERGERGEERERERYPCTFFQFEHFCRKKRKTFSIISPCRMDGIRKYLSRNIFNRKKAKKKIGKKLRFKLTLLKLAFNCEMTGHFAVYTVFEKIS
jgi:hypothetical protein